MKEKDRNLLGAVKEGKTKKILELLQAGANPNAKDMLGQTSLNWAITSLVPVKEKTVSPVGSHSEITLTNYAPSVENTRILLKAGADPNIEDNSKKTPLMEAVSRKPELVELLLSYGANPNHQALGGNTALMLASYHIGKKSSINKLIEYDADLNITDNCGKTALIWAINNENKEAVDILINAGANLDIQDRMGRTALIWATQKECKAIVQSILEAGADVSLADRAGNSAIDVAKQTNNKDILELLEKYKLEQDTKKEQEKSLEIRKLNAQKQRNLRRFLGERR